MIMEKILFATATTTETQAVLPVFEEATQRPKELERIEGKTYYNLGMLGQAEMTLVQSEAGTATPDGSLITVNDAIKALSPSTVIMIGIAFGMKPDKQKIGDILVSRYLRAYEPERMGEHPVSRGVYVNASSPLLDLVRTVEVDWTNPRVHIGLLLSGEKLVDNIQFRDALQKKEPDAIGGEMEGHGVYVAANKAKVDWILVKGISDWGDGNKSDQYQRLAAGNAARFALSMVLHFTPSTGRHRVPPLNGGQTGINSRSLSSGSIKQVQGMVSQLREMFSSHSRIYRDECEEALKQIEQINAFLNYHWVTAPAEYATLADFDYVIALIRSTHRLLQSLLGTCPPGDPDLRKEIKDLLKEIEDKISASLENFRR
jgi:nucleoside phosphorylase